MVIISEIDVNLNKDVKILKMRDFEYLRSKLTNTGGSKEDIKKRIEKAIVSYNMLNKI